MLNLKINNKIIDIYNSGKVSMIMFYMRPQFVTETSGNLKLQPFVR